MLRGLHGYRTLNALSKSAVAGEKNNGEVVINNQRWWHHPVDHHIGGRHFRRIELVSVAPNRVRITVYVRLQLTALNVIPKDNDIVDGTWRPHERLGDRSGPDNVETIVPQAFFKTSQRPVQTTGAGDGVFWGTVIGGWWRRVGGRYAVRGAAGRGLISAAAARQYNASEQQAGESSPNYPKGHTRPWSPNLSY